MAEITSLFVTRLYRAGLNELAKKKVDYAELHATCDAVAEDDEAGQEWCEANGYPGYTSYASLDDLPWRMPIFADLEKALDKHVAAFCKDLGFDLDGKKLKLNALWINILPEGGTHASHIHPHSVISGTTYVAMPEGTIGAEAGRPPPADDDDGAPDPQRCRRRSCNALSTSNPWSATCCCGKAGCATRCR